MEQIWQFWNFLKIRHFFWKSIKFHKVELKVILLVRSPCKTPSLITKMMVIILVGIFVFFSCSEKKKKKKKKKKKNVLFLLKFSFHKYQSRDIDRIDIR